MEMYALNLLTHLPPLDRQHAYHLFVARYNQHLFDFTSPQIVKIGVVSLQGFRYATSGLAKYVGLAGRHFPRTARLLGNAAASAQMLYGIQKHSLDLWFCPLINLAPRHVKLRSVVSIPDLQPEFFPDFFRRDLLEWSRRRYPASCRDSTKVITFSEFSRATIVDRYGIAPDKIHVIPLAIGDEFLCPPDNAELRAATAKYGLPAEYAFYPANTWPHKNHATLLKALSLLRAKHGRRLACVLTGEERGAHADILKAVETHDLGGQVHLLGYVERADMPALYRGASVLVFPSLFEGFGLPLLEAMASECPVVCSSAASLPEVAGNAALLFEPHDAEGLADAMHRVLADDGLRRALVAAGSERCREFSWETTARETLKVLEAAWYHRDGPAGRRT
jgi:glycosyltransferase involved in cell wall biosynthesis